MIHRTIFEDVFDPTRRQQETVPHFHGARLSDVTPEEMGSPMVAWHNGKLVVDDDPLLCDGDFVHLATPPAGPAIPYLLMAIVVAIVTGAIVQSMMPKEEQVEDNLGGGNYGYYGFRNAYRPEGDPIPVVYGTMRVAAPCINQSVTGEHSFASNGSSFVQGRSETLNSMYALSHGPILGLGDFQGDIFDTTAFHDVTDYKGYLADRIGLQINGVGGKHVAMRLEWRTGGSTQEPIQGLLGAGGLPVTDAGVTYNLGFVILFGTDNIDSGYYPAGTVDYVDRIQDSDAVQYVSQFLGTKADICNVQALWANGLFNQNSGGGFINKSAIVRIQYWKTDATDTTTGTVVILPEVKVTAASTSPFSVDVPFSLADPDTYIAPVQQGYAWTMSDTNDRVYSSNVSGMVNKFRCGSSGFDTDLQFTLACWFRLLSPKYAFNTWLLSWSNAEGRVSAQDRYYMGFGHLDNPSAFSNNEAFLGVCIRIDVGGILRGGKGDVFLVVVSSEKRNSKSAMSWWRSEYPIGNVSNMNDAHFPKYGWMHIALEYDGMNWAENGSGSGKWTAIIDGAPKPMVLGEDGEYFTSFYDLNGEPMPPEYDYNGTGPGFLWKNGSPTYTHVPPQFRVTSGGNNGFKIGGLADGSDTEPTRESRGYIAQYLLYDGIIPGGVAPWAFLAWFNSDDFGNRTYDIRSMAPDANLRVCCPFDAADVVSTDYYKNFAWPNGTGSGGTTADGVLFIEDVAATVKSTGGPIYTAGAGSTAKDYYHVEVFKEAPTYSGSSERDETTIDSITTWATQPYSYPSVAVLAASIQATDQINSNTPNITVLCHGKKVKVWDGGNEDVPVFSEEWSNNPAWVAMDMLTNRAYGMGSVFSPNGTYENIALRQFREWAQFCDEGVPDAFGLLNLFSIKADYILGPTTYYVVLRFGVVDTSDVLQQSVPESWKISDSFSIDTVTASGIDAGWVTANDTLDGANLASNRLRVESMTFLDGSTVLDDGSTVASHGWNGYLEVWCEWNRYDSAGAPIWPGSVSTGDEFVADNFSLATLGTAGVYEKRCTFDGVFDQKKASGWDAIINAFQAGRAMPVKAGRKIIPVWDRPRDPVALFTMANVVEGSLELAFMSPESNPNSIETEILDSQHGYERRTVLVDHDSIQDPTAFGQVRKERTRLLGVTRRSQALRDSYYRLNRYNLLRRRAKFSVGPDALNLLPGDRILLSHDVPQYGYSGRLPADMAITNIHPGARSLVAEWNQNGGSSSNSNRGLIVADSTTPPVTGYAAGSALMYSLPTSNASGVYTTAGEVGKSGFNTTVVWTSQLVTTASSLYPGQGGGVPLGPLDRIDYQTQKKEWSIYVKQPATGASSEIALNVYRFVDKDGDNVLSSHRVDFEWDGSGDLVFKRFAGGSGSSPYGMSYEDPPEDIGSGWYRATVFYDNGANGGAGDGCTPSSSDSCGVGDYIQARFYYSFDGSNQSTFKPSPNGRGSNLLYFGDPSSLTGLVDGSTAWTKVNDDADTNAIAHNTAVAPPFYPAGTGALAAKWGNVIEVTNSQTGGGGSVSFPAIQQAITLPTDWPGVNGAGDMTDEPICATFFLRVSPDNVASNKTGYFRMATQSTVFNGLYTGNQASWTITPSGAGTITYGEVESGATQTALLSQIAKVRQTSEADDADWYQIDVAFSTDTDFSTLYCQFSVGGSTGGNALLDVWGFRVHGAAGAVTKTGTTNYFINHCTHRGTLAWGPLYNPNSDGSTVTPWTEGGNIQLDRDVTVTAGESYEVFLRSSDALDTVTSSDATERVYLAASEVPASGDATKTARTALNVAAPKQFVPKAGDVYSFGKLDASVEDLVVQEITIDPMTMQRVITAVEYDATVYVDTAFGVMGDTTISDLPSPSSGGDSALYGMGGSGPQGSAFVISALSTPLRGKNAGATPSITVQFVPPRGTMPYKEVRLWMSQLDDDGNPNAPQLISTLPFSTQEYRHEDGTLDPDLTYRFYAQRVGWLGTCVPISGCPFADISPTVSPPILVAPSVEITTDGFEQMYKVAPNQDSRVASIEGRVGGWVISSPGFVVDPDSTRFTSRGIAIGATNDAGNTNVPVVSRARLASGKYGSASIVTPTASFVDAVTTHTKIAENDFAAILTLPADLQVSSGILQWDESVPSTALGPVYVSMDEFDLTTAKRAIPVCVIQGYQERPETLEDLGWKLDSEDARAWSIEGPMDDSGATPLNASVKVEWRWTSGASLSGDYVPFESQEVYFRKCQFRLVWTRPTAAFQVQLQRFTVKLYVPPLFAPGDVDGGTF